MPRLLHIHHCGLCGKGFSRKYNLKVHYQVHGEREKTKCTQCDKYFNRTSDVQRHIETAHLKVGFSCKICDKEFARKDATYRHLRRCHRVEEAMIKDVIIKKEVKVLSECFDHVSEKPPFKYEDRTPEPSPDIALKFTEVPEYTEVASKSTDLAPKFTEVAPEFTKLVSELAPYLVKNEDNFSYFEWYI